MFEWTPLSGAKSTLTTKEKQDYALRLAKENREREAEQQLNAYRQAQMVQIANQMQHQQASDALALQKEMAGLIKDYYGQYETHIKNAHDAAAKEYGEIAKSMTKEGGTTAQEMAALKYEGNMIGAVLKGMELAKKSPHHSPEALFQYNKDNASTIYQGLSPLQASQVSEFLRDLITQQRSGEAGAAEAAKKIENMSARAQAINMHITGESEIRQGKLSRQEVLANVYKEIYSKVPQYSQQDADAWVQHRMQSSMGSFGLPTQQKPGGPSTQADPGKVKVGGYIQDSSGRIQFVPGYGATPEQIQTIDKFNASRAAQEAPEFMKQRGYDPESRTKALEYLQNYLQKSNTQGPVAPLETSQKPPQPQVLTLGQRKQD